MSDIALSVHNETLSILLEHGLFGFALYLVNAFFLLWVFLGQKAKTYASKIALIAAVAYTATVQFGFSYVPHMLILISMWAIILRDVFQIRGLKITLNTVLKFAGTVALSAAAIAGLFYSYSFSAGDVYLEKGLNAYIKTDDRAALEYFEKSFSVNPHYIYPYRMAFFFYRNDLAMYETLQRWNRKVGEISNNNFQYYLDTAVLSFQKGEIDQASGFFDEARKRAPRWAVLWQTWGDIWFEKKDYPRAVYAYEQLTALAPPYYRWKPILSEKTPDEKEKYRIFTLSNEGFYEALSKLRRAYIYVGRVENAKELEAY